MNWFTGVVVYLLVWWTVLFAALPIGTRPDSEGDPAAGGWRGAPQRPMLGWKVIGTTLVSAVIWLGIYALVTSDWLSFREGWLALPEN
jgi:predicted secreted protein